MLVGLLYNVAIWADKFMFWYLPPNVRAHHRRPACLALIYDLPVFLSYLSIIPGMAVFLVRIETDFVEYYDKFYDARCAAAARSNTSSRCATEMVYAIQQGLGEIAKIQTLAVLVTFVAGRRCWMPWHLQPVPAFAACAGGGAGLQVGLMAILNVFFYLDQRRIVLVLAVEMVVLNIVFTALTLHLGPPFTDMAFWARCWSHCAQAWCC